MNNVCRLCGANVPSFMALSTGDKDKFLCLKCVNMAVEDSFGFCLGVSETALRLQKGELYGKGQVGGGGQKGGVARARRVR